LQNDAEDLRFECFLRHSKVDEVGQQRQFRAEVRRLVNGSDVHLKVGVNRRGSSIQVHRVNLPRFLLYLSQFEDGVENAADLVIHVFDENRFAELEAQLYFLDELARFLVKDLQVGNLRPQPLVRLHLWIYNDALASTEFLDYGILDTEGVGGQVVVDPLFDLQRVSEVGVKVELTSDSDVAVLDH